MATSKKVIPAIYRHTQATAALIWEISHNLGGNGSQGVPIVDCYITDNGYPSKIIPSRVEIVDRNTVWVTFSTARAGEAIIVV
jgi:hypothetical protein